MILPFSNTTLKETGPVLLTIESGSHFFALSLFVTNISPLLKKYSHNNENHVRISAVVAFLQLSVQYFASTDLNDNAAFCPIASLPETFQ